MNRLRRERGAVIVTVAILMTVLLGMAALAVDASYMLETRAELQATADAAAMAAVSGLVSSPTEARLRAEDYARRNPVLGQKPQISQSGLTFGQWDFGANRFLPTSTSPNAIRVNMRLSDTPALSNMRLFFAPAVGLQPVNIGAQATASLGNRNVVFALDISTSMDDLGGSPLQPITDTKIAASGFLSNLQNFPIRGDRAGYVVYNERATLVVRLTETFDTVRSAIEATQICYPPACGGYTNIAEGIRAARQELTSSRANSRGLRVAVVLSDGRANTTVNGSGGNMCLAGISPCATLAGNTAEQQSLDQARRMRDSGIVLYTISLGSDTNITLMERMALETGGEHFFAPTTETLDDVFRQISARIPVVLVE